jgi:ribonuclease T2
MRSYQILILAALATLSIANQYKYTLAQEWPGSVCRTQHCTSTYLANYDGSVWNLHGLWPDKQNGYICSNVFTCTAEPYQPGVLSSTTVAKMDKYWVGLYNSGDDFRSHEWTKHGTCWKGQALYKSS